MKDADSSGLHLEVVPGTMRGELETDKPFEENDFIFSNDHMCSLIQHGWDNAKRWLEHYPNMEAEMALYDEKYLKGKL